MQHGQNASMARTPEVNLDPNKPRAKFATPEYHDLWEEKYAIALSGKPIRFETDLVDQQHERVCNEIFLSPVFDVEGKVTAVFGIGHEIANESRRRPSAPPGFTAKSHF